MDTGIVHRAVLHLTAREGSTPKEAAQPFQSLVFCKEAIALRKQMDL